MNEGGGQGAEGGRGGVDCSMFIDMIAGGICPWACVAWLPKTTLVNHWQLKLIKT